MHIAVAEPFLSGSHARWINEYSSHSRHQISIFGLPGVNWKWRMLSGAISLASKMKNLESPPDLFLVSDMIDAALFRSLMGRDFANVPLVVYFHENQFSYPWSKKDRNKIFNQRYFGHINYTSALVSDAVLFNSEFHRMSFNEGILDTKKNAPDFRECFDPELIESKSRVLYPGVDLSTFDVYQEEGKSLYPDCKVPVILWNHRWDFDKNPAAFFNDCYRLKEKGIAFQLIVCGEELDTANKDFIVARERLASHILHWGYAKDFADYARLLWRADVIPVTSRQDFFGISIVEAIYCGCLPLLPDRLAYPEVFNRDKFPVIFYKNPEEKMEKLIRLLSGEMETPSGIQELAARYSWQRLLPEYDEFFQRVAEGGC